MIDIFFSKLGLNLGKYIGINTDGAAVIVLESCGAVSKNNVRFPCFNHALNNYLAQASTMPSIRNTIGTLKAIIVFFSRHPPKNINYYLIQLVINLLD